jgi:hypothetical protein
VAYRYDGWGLGTRTCSGGHRGVGWRSGVLCVIVSKGLGGRGRLCWIYREWLALNGTHITDLFQYQLRKEEVPGVQDGMPMLTSNIRKW